MCQEFFIVNKIRRTAQKKKVLHCLKRSHNEQLAFLSSSTSVDRFLSSLFPAEPEVLVPVVSRLIDVVFVNFVVVLKFPIISHSDTVSANDGNCDSDNLSGRGNDGVSDNDLDLVRDNDYIDSGSGSGSGNGIDTDNNSQSDNDSNRNSSKTTQHKRNLIKEFLRLFSL